MQLSQRIRGGILLRKAGAVTMRNETIRELWRYRELLYFFAWRDIKVRYRQAALLGGVGSDSTTVHDDYFHPLLW